MTTFYRERITCQNCGKASEHHRLGSSYQSGSPDLDTRPPELVRSTLHAEVEACPHCHYCAVDISSPAADAAGCVRSEVYQKQFKSPEYPPLANAFLCNAMIQEGIANFAAAGWASMKAAWACDDAEQSAAANKCRVQAVELFRKALSAGQTFADQLGAEDAMLVDLLRRSGQLEEAAKQIEMGLSKRPEEIIVQALKFERALIAGRDFGCHTIQEAWDGQ
jgi:hypothetical protein